MQRVLIEKGRQETTWMVLRKFGYNQHLELNATSPTIAKTSKRVPSQRAVHFIRMLFKKLDTRNKGKLTPDAIQSDAFLADPWTDPFDFPTCLLSPDNFITEKTFIDMWTLHCIVDPNSYLNALNYLGFNYHHTGQSAFSTHESNVLEIVLKGHVDRVWEKLTGVEGMPRTGIKSFENGSYIIVLNCPPHSLTPPPPPPCSYLMNKGKSMQTP